MSKQTHKTEGENRTQTVRLYPFVFTGNDPRKGWRIPLDEIKYNEQRDEGKGRSGRPFASERGEEPRSGMQYCSSLSFTNFGARYMDHELMTMWLSVDPLADKYPGISPYAYCVWNPVKLVDPNGMEISTHVDQDGNVVAVFNDGDNGVYQHQRNADGSSVTEYQLTKRAAKYGTSCGGTRIGETEYWDEFVSPETGETMTYYKLQIGASFDPKIRELHAKAKGMNLIEIANNSKGGGLFDMKKDYRNVGALLNGKYATSRSAGDFLAGYNAESGSLLGFGVSFETFQQLAGALHIEESNGGSLSKRQMVDIVLWGYYNSNSDQSNYKAPTWGEVPYQYRRSLEGWNYGLNH